MAGINRTIIITGPAQIQYGGQIFWSKGDVVVSPQFKRMGIDTAAWGKIEERFSDKRIVVSFEPEGRFTAALLAVLWPYASTLIGTSIYGATDSALVVWGRDGIKLTIPNAALTKMPSIRHGVNTTVVGSVEFTGLIANSADGSAEANYFTFTTLAYPGDAGFSVANIPTVGHRIIWKAAAAPWTSCALENGAEITFSMRLQEHSVDGLGTVDMRLAGLDVSCKAVPVGPTAADIMTALNNGASIGAAATTSDLTVKPDIAGGCQTILKKAQLVDASLAYGAATKRIGACTWTATRGFTAGAPDPLFAISVGT